MIPRDCKRLAEVDFPIAEVSKHAARETSIRWPWFHPKFPPTNPSLIHLDIPYHAYIKLPAVVQSRSVLQVGRGDDGLS